MSTRTPKAILRAAIITLTIGVTGGALAAPLTGSGANLPIPSPNPGEPPRQGAALSSITTAGFDGTWTAPALSPWIGTFSAVGPVPASTTYPAGLTRYDFTTLTAGVAPAGTIFFFGDVDTGSTTAEKFILSASDAGGSLITTPWLDEPMGVSGVGTGSGGTILPGNTPGWEWDAALSQYTIDGTTVTGGNPSLAMWLTSNVDMAFLSVERTSAFANFSLSAPIPEPSTAIMLLSVFALVERRRLT